jgi:ABC-type Na+ efflux pump permease subunit
VNIQRIKIIFIKDWKELIKSRQALLPMILVPLIFIVILPAVFILSALYLDASKFISGSEQFIKNFPQQLLPKEFNERQKIIYAMIVYFFAPFFLIIPVMISSVIASNSFAGEKERKTIEGLLYTPISDKELILGKVAVSFFPAVVISWICFLVYTIVVNVFSYQIFSYLFFPTLTWLVLIFWLVPIISFLSLVLIVAVSQKVSGVWEAQQISVLLILPIIGLVISQVGGVIYLSSPVVFIVGLLILVIDIIAYKWIVKTFDRERILTKLV